MEMSSANEIRYILNEIDKYKKYLKDIKDCKKLDGTLYNGYDETMVIYDRNSMEVKAIIKAYEKHIEDLEHRIYVMKWVESNE